MNYMFSINLHVCVYILSVYQLVLHLFDLQERHKKLLGSQKVNIPLQMFAKTMSNSTSTLS